MESIKIKNRFFVSKPNNETRLFAQYILSAKPASFLDMGSGTGYIAIFLNQNGIAVCASDIDVLAVKLTKHNARLNRADFPAIQSDLFSSVKGNFHAIGFNVPFSFEKNRISTFFTSFLREIPLFQGYIVWHIPKKTIDQRTLLISKFIQQGISYLEEGGSLFLCVYGQERSFIQDLCFVHRLKFEQYQDDYLQKRNIVFVRLIKKADTE